MRVSMFFILMAAIFIAPHTSEGAAKFGAVLMIAMFFLEVLVEKMK